MAKFRKNAKLALGDCIRIARDFGKPEEGKIGAAALARRFGVSRQIIYAVIEGKYSAQLRAIKEAEGMDLESLTLSKTVLVREGDCPVCNLPTGSPCLICAANQSAQDVEL